MEMAAQNVSQYFFLNPMTLEVHANAKEVSSENKTHTRVLD